MPRRRVAGKREVLPDPIYNSIAVTKFINGLMWAGQEVGRRADLFTARWTRLAKNRAKSRSRSLRRPLSTASRPTLEVKSRRIGGATYQVPLEVTARPPQYAGDPLDRHRTHADRSEKTMEDRLVGELLDSANGRGGAMKKKEDVHRMAEANKAFAHYRF